MMPPMIYDFIPVLLFFFAFKFYGIYAATVVGIVATLLQVIVTRWKKGIFDKQQLLTLIIFIIFGGMTLYFHNPIFVKWKPTILFWIFGSAFLLSHFFGKKPLIQRMLESVLESKQALPSHMIIPAVFWKKLNIAWGGFFIALGLTNILVAYYFSTDAWVNFKLYGTMGLLLLFSFIQAVWLSRYLSENK